jgi:hypothetical protein
MMIEPTDSDIGRAVIYTGNRYPGGELEEGVITSFNSAAVFVRYGAHKHSQATSREDLEWAHKTTVLEFEGERSEGARGSMTLEETQTSIAGLMDEIVSHFKPGRKITVLVRNPERESEDFCMTDDDLKSVAEMIERRRKLGHEG